jgi:hypothetical protein
MSTIKPCIFITRLRTEYGCVSVSCTMPSDTCANRLIALDRLRKDTKGLDEFLSSRRIDEHESYCSAIKLIRSHYFLAL